MFPLLRQFSIASAVALATAALLVVVLYRQMAFENALEHGEEANVAISQSLRNALWPEFHDHLTITTAGRDAASLKRDPATRSLLEVIESQLVNLPILKVKIYNARGLTVFSSQVEQIGTDKSASKGFMMAVAGGIVSDLAYRDQISAFGHRIKNVDVISTYVPIRTWDGEIEAVIEIHNDVTRIIDETTMDQITVGAATIGIFGLLYVALLLLFRRAARIMQRQHAELLANQDRLAKEVDQRSQAEAALSTLNDELEKRVVERTTELQAAREKLSRKQRLAALGQLIGTVGHELRNPLAVIRNSVAFISEAVAEADLDLKRPLGRTERNIKRCEAIISELLDFTRRRELNLETKEIDTWLPEVLEEYCSAKETKVSVDRDLQAPGETVALDLERFRRVLINVLDNACQAMAEPDRDGELRLTVTTRSTDARLEITVADTGAGIEPEALKEIFEPLFTTKRDGVGLGLPMVKEITEQHGGGVDIASEPGEGTRVTLWLPLRGAAEQAA